MNVKVAVRVKPSAGYPSIVSIDPEKKCLQLTPTGDSFEFDHIFPPETEQEEIYNTAVKDMTLRFMEGYNASIVAYGEVGTGKTYTIGSKDTFSGEKSGIIARVIRDVFDQIEAKPDVEFKVMISFLSVKDGKIDDLLSGKVIGSGMISKVMGNHVIGTNDLVVKSAEEALKCLYYGNYSLTFSKAKLCNIFYSVAVHQRRKGSSQDTPKLSKFLLVDLAVDEPVPNLRARAIDKTIRKVYDSVENHLTRMGRGEIFTVQKTNTLMCLLTEALRESFFGNSISLLLVCISPLAVEVSATAKSLKCGQNARKIKMSPVINDVPNLPKIQSALNKICAFIGSRSMNMNEFETSAMDILKDMPIYSLMRPLFAEKHLVTKDNVNNKLIDLYERKMKLDSERMSYAVPFSDKRYELFKAAQSDLVEPVSEKKRRSN